MLLFSLRPISVSFTFDKLKTAPITSPLFPLPAFDISPISHILAPINMHPRSGFYFTWFYFTFTNIKVEQPRVPSEL